jgi:hypothetical protein
VLTSLLSAAKKKCEESFRFGYLRGFQFDWVNKTVDVPKERPPSVNRIYGLVRTERPEARPSLPHERHQGR